MSWGSGHARQTAHTAARARKPPRRVIRQPSDWFQLNIIGEKKNCQDSFGHVAILVVNRTLRVRKANSHFGKKQESRHKTNNIIQ
ncbi:hypothetical protein EVAR_54514_1 [Eumeta japonica]|uniref:Uncharacterized protein n=1 Tax=Eumeta variegata TaxID=151549 RepID=A0A4C1YGC2_EUMVA|nr:hypothetical protein EVAR_54514_1 [Eumeta japonica]